MSKHMFVEINVILDVMSVSTRISLELSKTGVQILFNNTHTFLFKLFSMISFDLCMYTHYSVMLL